MTAGEGHFGESEEADVWRLRRDEAEDTPAHPGPVGKSGPRRYRGGERMAGLGTGAQWPGDV